MVPGRPFFMSSRSLNSQEVALVTSLIVSDLTASWWTRRHSVRNRTAARTSASSGTSTKPERKAVLLERHPHLKGASVTTRIYQLTLLVEAAPCPAPGTPSKSGLLRLTPATIPRLQGYSVVSARGGPTRCA